ncbi:MAG: hypothetical protein WC444_04080, partial [Candidatus Paceibacterota bacterium]
SRSELEYYLTSSETVLCQLDGQFTSRPAISHKSNDRTNMFGSEGLKPTELMMPPYEEYLPDAFSRSPDAIPMIGVPK